MIPDFIETYDTLTKEQCDSIIDWFEKQNDRKQNGVVGLGVVNKQIKHSTDVYCRFTEDEFFNPLILSALSDCFKKYCKKYSYLNDIHEQYLNDNNYNLQRYLPNEGYFLEHCENECRDSSRILAWTLYLNDVHDHGETLYTLYDRKISARAGKMVIWPAYWTHAHKGVVSPTETKYIATGWFEFT
mgnify:FL=1|tara:strand:- start:431 stop:988 length:558 start_codon:yes stop_codon:yes gene_type:complete